MITYQGIKPKKATKGSNGYDVFAQHIYIKNGDLCIDLGLKMQWDSSEGIHAFLVPRSSLSKFPFSVPNSFGVADSDYSGTYKMILRHDYLYITEYSERTGVIKGHLKWDENELRQDSSPYSVGDRCGQFLFLKDFDIDFFEGDIEGDRGGFGSTGK